MSIYVRLRFAWFVGAFSPILRDYLSDFTFPAKKKKRLVVVAHGGVIRAILDSVLRRPSPRIVNAGVSTLSNESGRWAVHTVNSLPLGDYRWRF